MPTKPPFDPSKPPLRRKSPNESSDQARTQPEQPILAARPSLSKAKRAGNIPRGGAQDPATASPDINEETIRKRAYELWEERGRLEGFQEEDWRRAEAELRGELQQAS